MELLNILHLHYSQRGHSDYPEDTWEITLPIKDEDDLNQIDDSELFEIEGF